MSQKKPLPCDMDAEKGVLGAILHNNDALPQVRGMLSDEYFASPSHRRIFQAMCELDDEQLPVEEITLGNWLNRSKDGAKKAGGRLYIAELMDATPVTANVLVYAEIVQQKHQARMAINGATALIKSVMESGRINGQGERFRDILDDIYSNTGTRARNIRDAMADYVRWFDSNDRPAFKARTYTELDGFIGGIGSERPTVIAARTGVGKTVFLVQTAIRNAKHNLPTLLLNLEMDERTIMARALSAQARIQGTHLLLKQHDQMVERDWDKLAEAAGELHKIPLYIHSPSKPITMDQLGAQVRWHQENKGVGLVVIDHLTRIKGAGKGIYEQQTYRMLGLVEMMRRQAVPVLVGAQIARSGEEAPSLTDLKGSGDIEENASAVIILHDPDPNKNAYKQILAKIAKNSNGRKGEWKLDYWPDNFKIG